MFAFRAPRRGSKIVAQGKATEAAMLGKGHATPNPSLFPVCRANPPAGAANREEGNGIILRPQPRAAPRCAAIMSSLQDAQACNTPTGGLCRAATRGYSLPALRVGES